MFGKKSARIMVIGLAIGAVLLAGCVPAGDEVRPAPVEEDTSNVQDQIIEPEPVVYDSREVVLGDTFEIALDANATTGYSWEIAEIDEDIVQLTKSEYIVDPNAEGLVGKGGKAVFRFEAVGSGETALKLIYHRSWETDVEPLRTTVVQVTVS